MRETEINEFDQDHMWAMEFPPVLYSLRTGLSSEATCKNMYAPPSKPGQNNFQPICRSCPKHNSPTSMPREMQKTERLYRKKQTRCPPKEEGEEQDQPVEPCGMHVAGTSAAAGPLLGQRSRQSRQSQGRGRCGGMLKAKAKTRRLIPFPPGTYSSDDMVLCMRSQRWDHMSRFALQALGRSTVTWRC